MNILFYDNTTKGGFILDILNKHKIYDMWSYFDQDDFYLVDDENTWKNKEAYDFFMNDLFVFTDGNDVPDLLTKEEFERFNLLFSEII